MNFFNVGFLEILVILILALILFGPQRLIGLADSLRKALTEFQRNASEMASAALEKSNVSESSGEERAEFVSEQDSQDTSPDPPPESEDDPDEDRASDNR